MVLQANGRENLCVRERTLPGIQLIKFSFSGSPCSAQFHALCITALSRAFLPSFGESNVREGGYRTKKLKIEINSNVI